MPRNNKEHTMYKEYLKKWREENFWWSVRWEEDGPAEETLNLTRKRVDYWKIINPEKLFLNNTLTS
jgi:hypothetical protein